MATAGHTAVPVANFEASPAWDAAGVAGDAGDARRGATKPSPVKKPARQARITIDLTIDIV